MDAPWRYPRAVSSVLVIPPSEEPLTVAQAKLRAGLTWPAGDARDALLTDYIAAARQRVELDTGLALLKQTRDVTMTILAGELVPLPMHALPLISITDPVGTPVTRFAIDANTRAITLSDGYATTGAWRIESGWPDQATLAKHAPLLVHAVGLLTAHFVTLGRDLASQTETYTVPEGYAGAVAPFVQVWVT